MKIIGLKAENIKRLKAVSLTIDDKQSLVVISGKNGQGKSSLLDALWYALGGKDTLPSKPIRKGTDKASVRLDLGDYIVTRTFTESDSYLKVENAEGASFNSPQALLDQLVGDLSFDPLAFAKQSPKTQRETLIDMLGIDIGPLEHKRKVAYDERTMVGRELKQLESRLSGMLVPDKKALAFKEVSVTELAREINEAERHNDAIDQVEEDLAEAESAVERLEDELREAKEEVVRLKAKKKESKRIDTGKLTAQLENAEKINAQAREVAKYKELAEEVEAKRRQYTEHDAAIVAVDIEKARLLEKTKMPIKGLGISEDGVTFNDIPFSQISAAEQLKVSLSIAIASNPKIRVIRIMDGSLLDADNLKVIEEIADKNDFQVWIERVDDTGKVGVVIEDGEVKTINE